MHDLFTGPLSDMQQYADGLRSFSCMHAELCNILGIVGCIHMTCFRKAAHASEKTLSHSFERVHQALAGHAEAQQWPGDAPVWHRHLEEQSWRTLGDLSQNSL